VVAPDRTWFTDPKRVYPITVDPTYANENAFSSFDTWVQTGVTTDQSTSARLRVGHNGTATARSFLSWPVAPFKNKHILGATLSLFETDSASCTPSTFLVRSATLASTATRWTSQPTIAGSYGSATVAKGHDSGCPAGRVSVNITGLVDAWSQASYPTGGMALTAQNEGDPNSWKEFTSNDNGTGLPFINFTYNRPPGTAAVPMVFSGVSYAPPSGASNIYTPYRRPWMTSKGTDPDGNNVRYVFEFHTSTTPSASTLKATCSSVSYPSGTTAGCAPGVDLPDNTQIYVRAHTTDRFLNSPWSVGWAHRGGG
jgi:hypothetical protein